MGFLTVAQGFNELRNSIENISFLFKQDLEWISLRLGKKCNKLSAKLE
jgi:hypothetical protein